MNQPFKYFLIVNGSRIEVNPLGVDRVRLRMEKEGGNIFFRRKLIGSYTFTNTDFDLLFSLERSGSRCAAVYFEIERFCSGNYVSEWLGVFSLNDVKWNLSLCQATVTPKVNDAYRCILENYGKEYNILDVPKAFPVSANIQVSGEFEFLFVYNASGDFELRSDFATWSTFLEIRNWQNGTTTNAGRRANEDVKFRQITKRLIPSTVSEREELSAQMAADGWAYISETSTHINYARQPAVPGFVPYIYKHDDDFYDKYPDLLQWNCGDLPDPSKYIVVKGRSADNCLDIRTKKGDERLVTLIWEFGTFYFDRNRKLLDVVNYLVDKTCPSAKPGTVNALSDFLTLPVNYATGKENKLQNLLISHKSDIINYKSSEPAKKGMISLKNLLEGLRTAFDLYWFLNDAGQFQLEHRSYFEAQGVIDLTIPEFGQYLAGAEVYSYETEKMPRFEKLTFADAAGDDFTQGVIEYSGACVNYEEGQDTQEENVTQFTTDINNLLINGANASLSGFVLLAHQYGVLIQEPGEVTGITQVNGHLAAANLMKHYHRHQRVLLSGRVNGKPTVFESALKTKKQTPLSIPACCSLDFSPYYSYITNIGSAGELQYAELNLKTNMVTAEIVHEVTIAGDSVSDRQFDNSFDDSFL
jgi:hypothetical protein